MLKTLEMKKFLPFVLAAVLMTSCDDGDLIVTEFAFENQQLQHCGTGDVQVLYNVNNDQINESIALIFNMDEEEFINLETPVEIDLGESARIVYRTFDAEVDDYYCSEIPPATPVVVTEYRSTSGGTVTITPQLRNVDDHDGDGVPTSLEKGDAETDFPDTDGDEIPDYLDIDDDNDNVRTSEEINDEEDNSLDRYFDTDADGTPDYLDEDDDGDETITRYEDLDENGNPGNDKNDEGIPNYLNPDIVDPFPVDTFLKNTISESYRLEVAVSNLTLQNQTGDGEEITMLNYILGYFDTPSRSITLPEEEEGNEEEENETEENTDGENTDGENSDGETSATRY